MRNKNVRGARIKISLMISMLIASSILVAESATGQVLEFIVDLDTPATETNRFSPSESVGVSRGLAFSLGYYPRSALRDGHPLRLGLLVGRRSLRIGQSTPRASNYNYSEFRVQGRAAVDILQRRNVAICGELAMGLSFMSDTVPCNEIFCNMPETAIIATPSIRTNLRISQRVSAIIEVKMTAYLNDAGSIYPFKSGGVVAVGLEVTSGREKAKGLGQTLEPNARALR